MDGTSIARDAGHRARGRHVVLLAIVMVAAAACATHRTPRATASVETPVSSPRATPTPIPASQLPPDYWINVGAAFVDAEHGWIARAKRSAGQLLVTSDGGVTWAAEDTAGVRPTAVAFVDPMHGWMAGTSGECASSPPTPCSSLVTTNDGGRTWTHVRLRTNDPIVRIALVSPTDGWILTERCDNRACSTHFTEIYQTRNGGASWDAIYPARVSVVMDIERLDAHTGWVLTASYVFVTHDGGRIWAAGNNPCHLVQPGWGTILFRGGPMSFSDAFHGWIGCSGPGGAGRVPGILYRTTDGGLTWTLTGSTPEGRQYPVPPGAGVFPTGATGIVFLNANDGWYVSDGPGGGPWRTQDGGHSWRAGAGTGGGGGGGLSTLEFADLSHGWAFGSQRLSRTTDGGAQWQSVELPP